MKDESANLGGPAAGGTNAQSLPAAVDWATNQAGLERLRIREKAHTREGDAIAAARRRPYTRTNGGPPGWPPVSARPGGRAIAQWSRLEAGRSDDLAVGS